LPAREFESQRRRLLAEMDDLEEQGAAWALLSMQYDVWPTEASRRQSKSTSASAVVLASAVGSAVGVHVDVC
jgi:ribosomal protein L16 Arg81 hydroxylase